MKVTNVGMYALRLSFGQTAQAASTQSSANAFSASASHPDRIVTRSATMLAVFGIALSSFSLKQMLSSNKPAAVTLRKF